MSNRATILACFECFLAYLRLYLIRVKNAKGVEGIKKFSIREVFIGGISTRAVIK